MSTNRKYPVLAALFVLALLVFVVTPFLGMKTISPAMLLASADNASAADIFWSIRMPRVMVAFLAGASLSVSGMAFQALFRNALATPFTLGVSSGASLGAAMYVKAGLVFSIFGISGMSLFAFLGAILSVLLVYSLTRVRKNSSTATMLLAGVAVSFFFSSLILFIQYMSDFTQSFRILRWLMGQLSVPGYSSVINLLPFAVTGGVIVLFLARELNQLVSGEEIAASRGVNVNRMKTIIFFAVSLMVGGVVAVCGPIGFVGMMAPHICRLLIGADHNYLTPASILFGGLFLAACDTLARTVIAPAEIPVGVITALLGGPFFIGLLVRKGAENSGF
jgi:iron complex transport system permease protein